MIDHWNCQELLYMDSIFKICIISDFVIRSLLSAGGPYNGEIWKIILKLSSKIPTLCVSLINNLTSQRPLTFWCLVNIWCLFKKNMSFSWLLANWCFSCNCCFSNSHVAASRAEIYFIKLSGFINSEWKSFFLDSLLKNVCMCDLFWFYRALTNDSLSQIQFSHLSQSTIKPKQITHTSLISLLLCALRIAKDPRLLHMDSKDSDQIGRMLRLIWIFPGCTDHFHGFVMLCFISQCSLFFQSLIATSLMVAIIMDFLKLKIFQM